MEHLKQLLTDLECISLADISAIPEANQDLITVRFEQAARCTKSGFSNKR
jgi:hypothetical protein